MIDVTIKRGDTLIADCTYRNATGAPVNLATAGITIKSAVRSSDGAELYPLEYIALDQTAFPGQYRLRGDSKNWTPGKALSWDIRYFRGPDSFSSRTLRIAVLESITP